MWARGDEDTGQGGGPDHGGTDRKDDLGEMHSPWYSLKRMKERMLSKVASKAHKWPQ